MEISRHSTSKYGLLKKKATCAANPDVAVLKNWTTQKLGHKEIVLGSQTFTVDSSKQQILIHILFQVLNLNAFKEDHMLEQKFMRNTNSTVQHIENGFTKTLGL